MIRPLLEDAKVREYHGRFHVQLEIPGSSTLAPHDIDRTGHLASWDLNPNAGAEGYEGLRSILVSREVPITKRGIQLSALQISGIGSRDPNFSEGMMLEPESQFNPPSSKNYMDLVPGTLMSTTYIQKGNLVNSRPKYRAFGTYTAKELGTKLKNTNTAAGIELKDMVTPHVEAYGRYLDEDLKNQEGQFGFMVFPVPSVTQQRITAEILDKCREFFNKSCLKDIPLPLAALAFYKIAAVYFVPVVAASREMHDKARCAHLQLHLSNSYLIRGLPFVMDWATMTALDQDRESNVMKRAVDLLRPQEGFQKLFESRFGEFLRREQLGTVSALMYELSLEVYSGNPLKEVNAAEEALRTSHLSRGPTRDYEVVVR